MKLRRWFSHRRLRAFRAPLYIHWSVPAVALLLLVISLDSITYAVVHMLGAVNLLVALINLIPAPEFDGAKAWRVIPLARNWWISRRTTKRMLRKWTRR